MSSLTLIDAKDAVVMQSGVPILSGINFEVAKGDFIYLIGKTGSGKSTLLKTLYGELPLNKGEISIAGFLLSKLEEHEIPFLRRKLGIVFQDFQLLTDRNVNLNLQFALAATGWIDKDKIQMRIKEVLEMVNLSSKGFKMPHELSGGEQQRIVIARALLNNPSIILADEPTGNLDPDATDEILHLLHQLDSEERAVLMATHDYRIIDKFQGRIMRCEDGALQEI